MSAVETGRRGEEWAAQALAGHGYVIMDANWRCRGGEIDLVAREGDIWVFVEVKLRTSTEYGLPEEAVDHRKRARLLRAAQLYLAEAGLDDAAWRIDVVAIELAPSGRVQRLTVHRDAVRYDG